MKSQHPPKLKTPPRQLFSCAFFRNCTQSSLSPTTPLSPPPHPPHSTPPRASLPPPPPLPVPPPPLKRSSTRPESSSSSSSSSSASHSFTQWKFPLPNSPIHALQNPNPFNSLPVPAERPQMPAADLRELFHVAQLQLTMGSEQDQIAALHCLERCLVPNPPSDPTCPPELMQGIVSSLKSPTGAKPATKVLLALCLAEGNRRVAVASGAVGAVVEAAMELEGAAAERALAALELMCTVAEGAAELRAHALAVPVMVSVMGLLEGRGREYAISVISVIYGGSGCGGGGGDEEGETVGAPPEEVARAVVLALQGECTARGKRKGAQLLKTLEDFGRLDLTHDNNGNNQQL